MQDATFDNLMNVGLGTLPASSDSIFESFENVGLGVLPASQDATSESFENVGLGPVQQTIVRLPRGWGYNVQSSSVTIIGDPDATLDSFENIT